MSNEQGGSLEIETEDGQVLTTEHGKPITTEPKVGEAAVGSAKLAADTGGGVDTSGGLD